MNFVEPIRDRKKITQVRYLLRGQGRFRDLLLFVVGINTALRISDLLDLQITHFLDDQGKIQQRFWTKEKKRGKRQEVVINESIREILEEYLAAYPGIGEKAENFVFFNPKNNQKWATYFPFIVSGVSSQSREVPTIRSLSKSHAQTQPVG